MRKKLLFIAISLLVTQLLAGCKTLAKPMLPLAAGQEKTAYEISVTVIPFTDKRIKANMYGSAYRYLIPLVPYGTIRYERPEEAKMFNCPEEARMFNGSSELKFNMVESLAKAVFEDLEREKIFSKVVFSPGPKEAETDLILSGDVNSTLYEGKTYSYGISFLSPILWSVGLPAGSSYNKLNLTLYLKKRDTNELIWTYVLSSEKSVMQGLYYNRGENVNNYVNLLKEEMGNTTKDLKRKLSKIPSEQLKVKVPEPPPVTQEPSKQPLASQGQPQQPPSASPAQPPQ